MTAAASARWRVLILLGSESDLPQIESGVELLRALAIPFRATVASAHRSPERVRQLVMEAEQGGAQVIIAVAGLAAHLAGAVAAQTILPVIGVPAAGSLMGGLDALLSTVQMPRDIPVATVAVGPTGGYNAAVLAAQILALSDKRLENELRERRGAQAQAVEGAARRVEERLAQHSPGAAPHTSP
ncbi:MAG: 5-(carboxyamino)imidazole ribonucleotide mutase [Candidatus Schekmanbacteria bacterium]|nr:5-(carboxyamino)imidazole ribonucleotide mutase [Candidatus Schekmanbacteria bacterium]